MYVVVIRCLILSSCVLVGYLIRVFIFLVAFLVFSWLFMWKAKTQESDISTISISGTLTKA